MTQIVRKLIPVQDDSSWDANLLVEQIVAVDIEYDLFIALSDHEDAVVEPVRIGLTEFLLGPQ